MPSGFDDSASKQGMPAPTSFRAPGRSTRIRIPGSKYTDAIGTKICERIMMGETFLEISKDPKMPSKRTLAKWLADPRLAEFREMYYYARRVQVEFLVDEIIPIADGTENDWKETYNKRGEFAGYKPDNEAIQRSRVRIDTRKWLAAKLIPRLYGEKVEMTHGVTGELGELIKQASNQNKGLPTPVTINGKYEQQTEDVE